MNMFGEQSHLEQIYPGYTSQPDEIDKMELMTEFNPYVAFGTLGNTLITLFNIAIMAQWADIMVPICLKQPEFILFFVVFYMIMFGLMNVIVGLIVDKVLTNAKRLEEDSKNKEMIMKLDTLGRIQELVAKVDERGDGCVTIDDVRKHMCAEDSELFQLLNSSDMSLPIGFSAEELLCMLDTDGDRVLRTDEFVESFYRLLHSGPFQQICMLQTSLNYLKQIQVENHKLTMERLERLEMLIESKCRPTATEELPRSPSMCGMYKAKIEADASGLVGTLNERLQGVLDTLERDLQTLFL